MKLSQLLSVLVLIAILISCGGHSNSPDLINSESFEAENVSLDHQIQHLLAADSIATKGQASEKITELEILVEKYAENPSDVAWKAVSEAWTQVNSKEIQEETTDSLLSGSLTQWIDLNIKLVKLTDDVRFGDALENILYQSKAPKISSAQLKSVIYTHVDDKIYLNILGSSAFSYRHTTGGIVHFVQKTDYPAGNEMVLSCELDDVRYIDVFIRIPSWAKNPTVTHGNVKYVARPGEYCEIYRKWKNGDEIVVKLNN